MAFLTEAANRGSIATGYDIENSLKFEPDNSETIQDAHNIAGNKRELTISFWCKITELGTQRMPLTAGARQARIWFDTNDQLTLQLQDAPGYLVKTNRVFRDTSAWYHIVVAIDTTQATDSNRIKLWVNGVQETSWATTQWPPQNFEGFFNVNQSHHVSDPGYYFAGYIADFFFIDDQVLQATDFGEYDEDSGIWIPKEYDGTFSGQSFYLKFDNASDLDERSDGLSNGVSMSLYNITAADQATDTPTNNFCTLNQAAFTLTDATISQGATSFFNTLSDTRTAVATMAVTKGKWYFEYKFISAGGSTYWPAIGFTNAESTSSNLSAGSDSDSSVLLLPNGTPYENGTIGSSNYSYFGANDIAGVALDVDNGNMYLYKNGTIQNSGNPIFTSIGDFIMPLGTTYGNGCGGYFNFGGFTSYTPASPATDENGYGTFEYAPPTGYYALCTKNLAEYG